jgi:hypothetical protein
MKISAISVILSFLIVVSSAFSKKPCGSSCSTVDIVGDLYGTAPIARELKCNYDLHQGTFGWFEGHNVYLDHPQQILVKGYFTGPLEKEATSTYNVAAFRVEQINDVILLDPINTYVYVKFYKQDIALYSRIKCGKIQRISLRGCFGEVWEKTGAQIYTENEYFMINRIYDQKPIICGDQGSVGVQSKFSK